MTSGPFIMTSWRPQEEFVLERYPRYHEHGLPVLDRVVFRVIPDRGNHVTQLLRGEVDFVPRVDVDKVERVQSADNAVLYPYRHRQYTYLGWNTRRPLFSEPEVRRALTLAVDRQTIIDTLRSGWAVVASSPVLGYVWAVPALWPWPCSPGAAL